MYQNRILSLLICLFCQFSLLAAEEPNPLGTFDTSPLYALSLGGPVFSHADTLVTPAGKLSITTTLIWGNTFRHDEGTRIAGTLVTIDNDFFAQRLVGRWGLVKDLEANLWCETTAQWSGCLDTFIEGFHKNLGFPNQNRDQYLQNQFKLKVITASGTLLFTEDQTWALSSLGLGLKYRIPIDFPLVIKASFRPPLLSSPTFLWTSRTSLETAVVTEGRFANLNWGISAGLAYQDTTGLPAVVLYRNWLLRSGAHLFWYFVPRFYLGVEVVYSQGPIDSQQDYLGNHWGNTWIGGKIQVTPEWIVEAAVIEEFLTWSSLEAAFQVGVTWRPQ